MTTCGNGKEMSQGLPDTNPIYLIGDEMPMCPHCGARLEVDDLNPVDHDTQGPILKATCLEHGDMLIQNMDEEEEEDEEAA